MPQAASPRDTLAQESTLSGSHSSGASRLIRSSRSSCFRARSVSRVLRAPRVRRSQFQCKPAHVRRCTLSKQCDPAPTAPDGRGSISALVVFRAATIGSGSQEVCNAVSNPSAGLLSLLLVITYLDRVCISVAGPRMQEALHIGPFAWGWVTGIFTVAYAAFEIPSGALGDRIGPRRVLTRIVLWWSAFTSLTGMATGYYPLC